MPDRVYRICVEVPIEAGPDVTDAIYTAVSDAAFDAEPATRDGWDIFVYGTQVDVADEEEIEQFGRELGLIDD